MSTDRPCYQPGEPVQITATGWAGVPSIGDFPRIFWAIANASGDPVFETANLLTAVGSFSGTLNGTWNQTYRLLGGAPTGPVPPGTYVIWFYELTPPGEQPTDWVVPARVEIGDCGSEPAVFLVIDEDSIDNGSPPNFFSDVDVNDDIAEIAVRTPLRYFADHVGETITLYTGEIGDEGWFEPLTIPESWDAAGPTPDGLRNFVGNPSVPFPHNVGPGLGTPDANGDRESLLDNVPEVLPLREDELEALVGRVVCAVVYDSDVSVDYDPLRGSLKGANLGTVAFLVIDVVPRTDGSSSSLPAVTIEILDAAVVCEGELGGGGEEPGSGAICGSKFHDVDEDRARDPQEATLPGWTIELLHNGSVVAIRVTDASGRYCFVDLAPGTYVVREVLLGGGDGQSWVQTFPAEHGMWTFDVTPGFAVGDADFGNACRFAAGRTMGYWKTHTGFHAPPRDDAYDLLPANPLPVDLATPDGDMEIDTDAEADWLFDGAGEGDPPNCSGTCRTLFRAQLLALHMNLLKFPAMGDAVYVFDGDPRSGMTVRAIYEAAVEALLTEGPEFDFASFQETLDRINNSGNGSGVLRCP